VYADTGTGNKDDRHMCSTQIDVLTNTEAEANVITHKRSVRNSDRMPLLEKLYLRKYVLWGAPVPVPEQKIGSVPV